MPYPILLAVGAALAAAGTGMSIAGNEQAKAAMERAQAAEGRRQKKYQQEAQGALSQSIDQSTRGVADKQLAEGEAARLKAYAEAGKTPLQALPTGTSGNAVVGNKSNPIADARARAAATANAWNQLASKAQARMGSYEDWGLKQGVKNARANQNLGIVSSLARGSANVLPIEIQDAAHSGDELSGWGQLVSALGMVAGAGAGAFAAPAAAGSSAAASTPTLGGMGSSVGGTALMGANAWGAVARPYN